MWRGRLQARSVWLVAGLTSMAMIGCTNSEAPELSIPAKFTLVSGDAQTANGVAVPSPLTVRVSDVRDHPLGGITVNWVASDGALNAASSTTDDQGQAKVTWTLGTTAGRQTVTATTPSIAGAQVVFQANNGGVISGGITLQTAPPIAFASLSRGAVGSGSSSALSGDANRHVLRSTGATASLAGDNRAARRLIVTFRPAAMSLSIAMSPGAIQPNARLMRSVLAGHVALKRVSRLELSPAIFTARVTVPTDANMDSAVAALRADASVASVTADRIVPMLGPVAVTPFSGRQYAAPPLSAQAHGGATPGLLPNDGLLLYQLWHYKLIDAPRAWTTNQGSKSVLVAVVDQGVRFEHPAMGLGAASNFTQDGYNFVAGGDRLTVPEAVCAPAGPLGATTTLHEAGPGPDPTLPDDLRFNSADNCWSREMGGDHGLHVSGTIGAIGNDALGVTGINWKVSIRPVRVLDVTGGGSSFDVAQGILYAAGLPASDGNGGTVTAPSRASVINLSIGGPDDSVLASAVTAATSAGSLLIASAGNGETSDASFPAGYPEVVGVSSIGPDLSLSSFTNIGGNVSLAAPGGNFRSGGVGFSGILSTTWNYVTQLANYAFYEGTSMAAPHVTGIAALVLEANPGMTNAQLRARLQSTALHVGAPGRNDQHGFGIVNAYNAITNSVGPTRKLFASVYNAATGAQLQTVAVAANGTYSFSRLPAGSYFVYGGEDENSDGVIGVPGRRFGWFGGAGAPTPIAITTGGNASSSFTVGTPIESKPHSTIAASNKLVVNSYMIGQITATDGPGVYSIQVPGAVKYFFEAGAVLGTCGFGIELNTKLELLDANGATLATNDDAGLPGGPFCSGINGTFQGAGQYYLRVSGSTNPNGPPQPTGQYRIWVRDQP